MSAAVSLVQRIARAHSRALRFERRSVDRQDAESIGMVAGLAFLNECERLGENPTIEQLRSRVRSAMLSCLKEIDGLSRSERRALHQIAEAERSLLRREAKEPSIEDLAQELGLPIERVRYLRLLEEYKPGPVSGGRVSSVIASDDGDPLRQILRAENQALLDRAMKKLKPKEKECIALSFYENLTLKEIGERMGFTEARASQIRSEALRRLRKHLTVT